MKNKFTLTVILAVILATVLSACDADPKVGIAGRWYGTNEVNGHIASYEFFDDGTYVLWHDDRTSFSDGHGTYSVQDGKLKINDYASGTDIFDLEIKSDSLIIDGEIFTKEYKTKNDELTEDTKQNINVDSVPVSVGNSYVLAITADGTLYKIDTEKLRQSQDIPRIGLSDNVSSVSATYEGNNMAIKNNGMLFAWGKNTSGEVGNGTCEAVTEPEEIMSNTIECSSGAGYSLAVRNDNTLWGWGDNQSGCLGGAVKEMIKTPQKLMDNVLKVSAGKSHVMAVKKDNTLWTWGANSEGQLGDGTQSHNTVPQEIMKDVRYVSAGSAHSMALKLDGSLWAWGNNFFGQLGDGTRENASEPKKIMDNVRYISAGGSYSLAVKEDNTLWVWGKGALVTAAENSANITTPQKISDDINYISAGYNFAAATTNDGKVILWNDNKTGLFVNAAGESSQTPFEILDNALLK